MENHVYDISGAHCKAFLLTNEEIWLSIHKQSNIEKFEKSASSTGTWRTGYKIQLQSIYEIEFNDKSESVKFRYVAEKDKKLDIAFENKQEANAIVEYIATKLGLHKSTREENKLKPLLTNGFFLVIVVLGTISISNKHDSSEITSSGSSRNRLGARIIGWLYDTIGPTGILIAGIVISLYILFRIYKRFTQPGTVVIYTK